MLKALRHSKQFDKMRIIMHALQGVKVLDHNNDRLKGFRQSKFEIILQSGSTSCSSYTYYGSKQPEI